MSTVIESSSVTWDSVSDVHTHINTFPKSHRRGEAHDLVRPLPLVLQQVQQDLPDLRVVRWVTVVRDPLAHQPRYAALENRIAGCDIVSR